MILHITSTVAWKSQEDDQFFAPSAFWHEGFIHCCSSQQVGGVLERYFSGQTDLLVLHIEESKLESPLRYEPAANGELFPHVYGRIPKKAIKEITPITAS